MTNYDSILRDVAARTLEGLAMMFLVPPEEAPARGTAVLCAGVAFSGPLQGRLALEACPGLVRSLAGNMLGLEDHQNPSQQQQGDALKELANVVCGNLLPELAGDREVFHLDAPELTALVPTEAADGQAEVAADAGWLRLRLYMRQGALLEARP